MKIATWNVNGIRAREAQLLEWVHAHRPDVLCLQEIKATLEQVPAALCTLEGYWCLWHGHKGYSGVGLHLAKATFPSEPRYFHPEFDHETRIASTIVGDHEFASVYVPNGGKDYAAKLTFLEALSKYAENAKASGRRLVVCGDLNVARTDMDVHARERKLGVVGQRPDERALLERVIAAGLVDVTRALHPDDAELFTWWAPWRNMRQRNIGWRIDYILAATELAARAESAVSMREFGTSDHAPLVATFAA